MSFFKCFFAVFCGVLFAKWATQDKSQHDWHGSSTQRTIEVNTEALKNVWNEIFHGNAQRCSYTARAGRKYTEHVSQEDSWAFNPDSIKRLSGHVHNGSFTVLGTDTAKDISIEARIEISSHDKKRSQDYLEKTRFLVEEDVKTHVLKLGYSRPSWIINANIEVHWKITCPRDKALKLAASNGNIAVDNINGALNLSSKNGELITHAPELTQQATFRTKNGSLKLQIGDLAPTAHITAETKNGLIVLSLPQDSEYGIAATTKNGVINSAFPVYLHGTKTKNIQIDLHAKNGSIEIRKEIRKEKKDTSLVTAAQIDKQEAVAVQQEEQLHGIH